MKNILVQLRTYYTGWLSYLSWKARLGWAFFAPIILVVMLLDTGALTEPALRWSGALLQVSGFLLAILDIVGREKLFNVPSLLGKLRQFIDSRPRWPTGATIELSGAIHMSVSGSANLTVRKGHDGTQEGRLDAIEANLKSLEVEVYSHLDALQKSIIEVSGKADDNRQQLQDSLLATNTKLDRALSSGITMEWLGIWYFVFGVIIASGSVEICKWVGNVCHAGI